MAITINNFVVDRPIMGMMFSKNTGDLLWKIDQIEEPSLSCSSDTEEAVDAIGSPVMIFDRAKRAEFSASNSFLDMGLAAAQFGTDKSIATTASKITVPKFEEFVTTTDQTTIVLAHVPVGIVGSEIKKIYAVNPNKTIGTEYKLAASTASDTEFTLDAATKTITLPTGLSVGTKILVNYDYESENVVAVTNSADKFPVAGKFVLRVLGHDVCDAETVYMAMIIMPSAKLTSAVDLTFNTTGKHPFTIQAMQDYCSTNKELFTIAIVNDDDE